MASHILTRPEGKAYYLTLELEVAVFLADKIVKGEMISAKGDVFPGKGCKLDTVNQGDFEAAGRWMDKLQAGEYSGFWQEVVGVNFTRQNNRKPWLFEKDISSFKRRFPDMKAGDLMAYIEWKI